MKTTLLFLSAVTAILTLANAIELTTRRLAAPATFALPTHNATTDVASRNVPDVLNALISSNHTANQFPQNNAATNDANTLALSPFFTTTATTSSTRSAPTSFQTQPLSFRREDSKNEDFGNRADFQRTKPVQKIHKTEAEWKQILTPEQFQVMREKGTERPFSCALSSHDKGVFQCAACGLELFRNETKFDSGTGWPSFFSPIEGHVSNEVDNAHGMRRTEVLCASCDSHLGHVFDDGPAPTGLRYCMNGVALKFKKDEEQK